MQLWIADDFRQFLPSDNQQAFDWCMALSGESVRRVEKRHTFRTRIHDQQVYVKHHFGVMWAEVIKDLLRMTPPVLGADNEYRVSNYFEQIGILCALPLAVGVSGSIWERKSFLVTRSLPETITLNQLIMSWVSNSPSFKIKQNYIEKVARIARNMHAGGVNHRDFYINHFRVPIEHQDSFDAPIYLMDLHRAQLRREIPRRWLVKDLSSLLFSCMGKSMTQRDWMRFIKHYRGGESLRGILCHEKEFWGDVHKKAFAMRRRHLRKIGNA